MSSDEPAPAVEPAPAEEPAPEDEPDHGSDPLQPTEAPGGEPADTLADNIADTLADTVAAAVLAVPGVGGLHGGAHGEVATYLPGRRVAGVRLAEDRSEVHVVLDWGAALRETTDLVRDAVRGCRPEVLVVDVTVEDIGAPAAAGA